MPSKFPFSTRLPDQPSLENLRKQAKRLLKDLHSGDSKAISRLNEHLPRVSDAAAATLSEAQLALAREYGFPSWPALKTVVEAQRQRLRTELDSPDEPNNTIIEKGLVGVPVLPIRDFVLFPGMEAPIYVGRAKSLNALDAATARKPIFLCSQHDSQINEPSSDDVYHTGTLCTITKKQLLDEGKVNVLVRGDRRALALKIDFSGAYVTATVQTLDEPLREVSQRQMMRAKSVMLRVGERLNLPPELGAAVREASEPGRLADLAAQYLNFFVAKRQALLELTDPKERLGYVVSELRSLLDEIEQMSTSDFVGRYQMAPGFIVEVSRDEEQLIAVSPWARWALTPQGGDIFAPHPEPRLVNELGLKPLYVTMAWYQNVSSYKFNRGDNGSASRLTRRDRFLWPDGRKLGDGEKPSPAIVLSESVLRRYVGHYEHNPKSLSKIALEAKRLWLDSHELESISETEFLGKKEPLQVSFKLNESRDVTGMRVRSIGSRRQYRKVAPQMITDRY